MKLTFFYLPLCPYCKQARKVMAELMAEHPEYKAVELDEVNEITNPGVVKNYDYYHVPCFFNGEQKLYEADPNDPEDVVKSKLDDMFRALVG
ncbi:MAG: thioredoxin family protein [Clostridiales bacterium]|nr:thioredoxin family protein [Clostridiales bacterium]